MNQLWPFLKHVTKDHELWPFGLVAFGTQFRKAADALTIKDSAVPDATPGSDNETMEMAKRQNCGEVRETCAIGSGVSVVQRHAHRAFQEECADRLDEAVILGTVAPVVVPPL